MFYFAFPSLFYVSSLAIHRHTMPRDTAHQIGIIRNRFVGTARDIMQRNPSRLVRSFSSTLQKAFDVAYIEAQKNCPLQKISETVMRSVGFQRLAAVVSTPGRSQQDESDVNDLVQAFVTSVRETDNTTRIFAAFSVRMLDLTLDAGL